MKLNPREPFFMAVTVTEKDGSIRFETEIPTGATTADAAIQKVSDTIEDHGGIAFVYRCVPVKRVSAYRLKVEDIDPSKQPPE